MQSDSAIELEMIKVAEDIASGKVDPIVGARFIVDNRFRLENSEGVDFDFFIALVSETEMAPTIDNRKYCSEENLKKIDGETEQYLSLMAEKIIKSAKKLSEELSSQ